MYAARVAHRRDQRLSRTFAHRIYLWLVDLDELPRLPRWLRPFARFEGRDHLAGTGGSIRAGLDGWLADHGVDLDGGRVLMLANARLLGYVFNPLTVYWCHRRDGPLACVVAEVHNTYGERHCYLLHPDADGRAVAAKEFYVSPFLAVRGRYRMALPLPTDRLDLSVTLHQDGRDVLAATVAGQRRPATPAALLWLLLSRPLTTQRTWWLIRRHGIALWLRRLPVTARTGGDPTAVPTAFPTAFPTAAATSTAPEATR
ncbi:MAG TPA: DUF1365 domain-containing protein [Pseudonocardia sp.]|nr:DUF1365 domain-containing protein [Pseudonocardia sp.]